MALIINLTAQQTANMIYLYTFFYRKDVRENLRQMMEQLECD